LETIVSRENALRFTYIGVSGLLLVGVNAVWNGLGNVNPIAWALEWSAIILTFLCVFSAVKTIDFTRHLYGYILIGISVLVAMVSYVMSAMQSPINAATSISIDPYLFVILAAPIAVLVLVVINDLKNKVHAKLMPMLFFFLSLATVGFMLYMYYSFAPMFPTDESVFDMYAAHLFLLGKNPYNPALMSSAFSFYGFHFGPFDPITPLRTGGYVDRLTYPALSFLFFIPAVLLKLKPSAIMLPVLLAPMVIVWYRAWSMKQWVMSSYALIPFLSLLIYAYQGASADTDALWASLLMLSYIVLPRTKVSGVLFGLSLSVKQLPLLVLPFFLYFLYKEHGPRDMLKWLLIAFVIFFTVNGYFILLNPGYWFSSMLEDEFAPLIGIGFGVPQIAFAGIFQIPNVYFTLIMMDLFLFLLIIYVLKYREMKYALFAFPILIFLFNYRLFPQYLYYWIILSILPMIDVITRMENVEGKKKHMALNTGKLDPRIKKGVVVLVIIILAGSVVLGYHEGVQKSEGYFKIDSVSFSSYNSTGFVDKMNIDITYHGSMNNISHVYFRIFQTGPIVNGNMYLWFTSNNTIIHPGKIDNLTIIPQYQEYSVNPDISTMIVAYYGNIQGSFHLT